jgi:hypothetical protein
MASRPVASASDRDPVPGGRTNAPWRRIRCSGGPSEADRFTIFDHDSLILLNSIRHSEKRFIAQTCGSRR